DYPFHFQHQPLWEQHGDRGVTQEIYDLEQRWIDLLKEHSAFVARGKTQKSVLLRDDKRVFIEAMMFDRYSNVAAWRCGPDPQRPVMAITFEGTYRLGPDGGWSTDNDYREVGK